MANAMSPIERAQAKLDALMQAAGMTGNDSEGPQQADTGAAIDDSTQNTGVVAVAESQQQPQDTRDEHVGIETQPATKRHDTEDREESSFRHKYLTLQGMYRKQQEQINQLMEQNRQLLARLEERAQQQQIAAPASASASDIQDHLYALSEEYGEGFAKALKAFVQAELGTILKEHLEPVQSRVESVVAETTRAKQEQFIAALTQRVPDWNSIYQSDAFHGWLSTEYEPASGRSYAELFEAANVGFNLESMATIFNRYKEAMGIAKRSSNTPDQIADDPRAVLVSPGKGRASQPQPAQDNSQRIWTAEKIRQFYRDLRDGRYIGREAEAARIEAEIIAANTTGRVVG